MAIVGDGDHSRGVVETSLERRRLDADTELVKKYQGSKVNICKRASAF